jgi:signal transduction histidine kinase
VRYDLRNPNEPIAPGSSHFVSAASLRERLDWFNKLRWGAVAAVLLVVLIVGLGLKAPIEVRGLLLTGVVLLLLNTGYVLRNRRFKAVDIAIELRLVKVQMVCDLIVLTVLLNLSGGIENPLLFVYIIHVFIASLLFKGQEIFQIAWLAIFLFTAEVFGEYFGLLPHHHLPTASEVAHELPFILMTLGSFWFTILFCAYVGALIMRHNRAIKDELVVRQGELFAQDRAKSDFFRFVTHEIKSPVNTAQSAVETALELGGSDLGHKVEDMLHRAVARLDQATRIITDLAALTRGGYAKAENLGEVDLNQLVQRVVDGQRVIASRDNIHIKLMRPRHTVLIKSISDMIETIVANLVSNAVRYSRENGRITVKVVETGRRVRIVVEDEGIGIASDELDQIFDEFYRTPSAREKSNLGTGLGLPIVKKFVEGLGGYIEVKSTPGSGSTFTVTLPRKTRKLRNLPR